MPHDLPASRCGARTATGLAAFARSASGNVAILFAFTIIPILGLIGAAVDYSMANRARSAMQAAVDNTSLMLSRDLAQGVITAADVNTRASAYFAGLFNNKGINGIAVSASYTTSGANGGAAIAVNGSGSITTNFLKLIGFPTINFNVASTTAWGSSLLRVALVLDNTGSMLSGNKIGALQTAATSLVNQLSTMAKNSGDVMISVIPFANDVNVGVANKGASWLRWDRFDPNIWSNVLLLQTWCSDGGVGRSLAQCQDRGYTWNHSPGSPNTALWNGCVTDRDQNYDVTSTAPATGNTATLFIADQDPYCPTAEILPLSYDWTQIKTTIASMVANGATNQAIGLQWGWFSLLQQAPLNAPAPKPGETHQKIIVLFTDGLNTANRWYGDYASVSTQVDGRMKTLCDNIKASGITIYTIQIDTDGAGQSAVLPYCASSPAHFTMLTAPSQIADAFSQIGTQITKLRVAR